MIIWIYYDGIAAHFVHHDAMFFVATPLLGRDNSNTYRTSFISLKENQIRVCHWTNEVLDPERISYTCSESGNKYIHKEQKRNSNAKEIRT